MLWYINAYQAGNIMYLDTKMVHGGGYNYKHILFKFEKKMMNHWQKGVVTKVVLNGSISAA